MGWAKYFEDNAEIINNRLYMKSHDIGETKRESPRFAPAPQQNIRNGTAGKKKKARPLQHI